MEETALRVGGEYLLSSPAGRNTLAVRIVKVYEYVPFDGGRVYASVSAYRIRRTGDRASFGKIQFYLRNVTDFTEL